MPRLSSLVFLVRTSPLLLRLYGPRRVTPWSAGSADRSVPMPALLQSLTERWQRYQASEVDRSLVAHLAEKRRRRGQHLPLDRPELLREGLLVDLDGTIFTAGAVEKARQVVREGFERHGSLTVSQARDLLGSSRKYVLAILAHFDAEGVTRRRGDERFPGPRLGS